MITQVPDTYLSHALEAAVAATLLILLVLAIRKPVARHFGAGIAYALWLLPIARLLLPPLPHQASLFSWLKLPAGTPEPAAFTVRESATATPGVPAPPAEAVTAAPLEIVPAPPSAAFDMPAPHSALVETPDLFVYAGLIGLAVWIGGVLYVLARSLHTHMQFMAIVEREGLPVTGDLEALSIEVAREAGLKRMPRVVTSLISSGPFVTGLFRPAVVLPAWFAQDYSRTEARAAIAHELTHVKRSDLWALQASEIFVALMWFNPLAYIARQAFRTDQEAACDADVLRRGHASPHAYGATLVKAVRMQMPARIALTTSLPLTHALKERLKLMSYPAPDTRRRWIGFGAAVLLGTTALVGTASVAAAGEKDKNSLKIENGTLWLDGEKVDNRQVVLLTDPVEGLVPNPPVPSDIHDLSMSIEADVAELTGPEGLVDVIDLARDPDFQEITRLSTELALMGASLGTDAAFESLKMNFAGMSEDEIDAWAEEFEARMEAKAEEIEARAAQMEAEIEARSAVFEARMDHASEARALEIERRVEANAARIEAEAARIEAEVERHYGEEFQSRIEARTGLIPELAEECAALDLADGETRIIERQTDDGHSVKIACAAGGEDVLRAETTRGFINSNAGLSEEEKAKFRQHSSNSDKHTFTFSTKTSTSKTPAEPSPPATPEVPAPPSDLLGEEKHTSLFPFSTALSLNEEACDAA
ncbi:peptidase, M56 family [Hyphomonas neptunium ATCC 15444]|uniref:Peptidase, M56 family n=2 Tax=Hyphomonas TaxID=85 RepID=Q0BY59_HYPNA|nr:MULTISPECIES: M56 family peptidase [Hyphomonas]ABI77223.1 peptidase, M56 family [Hyphomonas neptunium ATCC 15444]KCZ88814.1 M56 family peptidase [Hyphomonas hirschiana VP5]